MTDAESAGFTIIDRRHAVQEAAPPDPEPLPQEPTPEPTTPLAPTQETYAASSDAPEMQEPSAFPSPDTAAPEDGADEERGLPDPAMILSLVALQMDARQLAALLLPVFDGQAWRAMGLLPHPLTGETKTDLPAAQLAIDCVQFLFGKVEPGLPDAERREAQRRLNDLRMNYLAKLRDGV